MMRAVRNDLDLYERHAALWWDARGSFAATLHGVNELRLQHLAAVYGRDMRGVVAVDLGCGGGILAEPMARMGATVMGIDRSAASIAVAKAHGTGIVGLRYEEGDARQPSLPAHCADLVTCADLLEHVDGWDQVLHGAATLLRPNGRLYVSTLNRTVACRLLAVYLAEGLRLIPPGTHDPARLIRPQELIDVAAAANLRLDQLLGQRLRLAATLRHWAIRLAPGSSTALGYAAWFVRGVP
jgi:2-polyprenyl-6-hydroxyphenyl methylase / 3-demethylubiquinone-9 3-methyltransferase